MSRICGNGPLCRLRKAQRCKELKVRHSVQTSFCQWDRLRDFNSVSSQRSPISPPHLFRWMHLCSLKQTTKGHANVFFFPLLSSEAMKGKEQERKISSRARIAKRLQAAELFSWEGGFREIHLWASCTEEMQSEWKCNILRPAINSVQQELQPAPHWYYRVS